VPLSLRRRPAILPFRPFRRPRCRRFPLPDRRRRFRRFPPSRPMPSHRPPRSGPRAQCRRKREGHTSMTQGKGLAFAFSCSPFASCAQPDVVSRSPGGLPIHGERGRRVPPRHVRGSEVLAARSDRQLGIGCPGRRGIGSTASPERPDRARLDGRPSIRGALGRTRKSSSRAIY